ncbi:MAG: DUF4384 domain-containing protein [bacterium]|jgi:hypothetical protein
MRSKLILAASLAIVLALALSAAGSTVGPQAYVDVWTDLGEGEIYNRGDAIDVFVESSFDAYVIVYSIDTDGYMNVLFPYDCSDDGFLRGGRAYRIVTGEEDGFVADGSKGVAYLRAVASATPFRRIYWPGCPGYERYSGSVTWSSFADYWGPALPPQIYGDPYIAMQSIDEFICWDSINSGAVAIDYTYYYVMEQVERPVYYVRTGWSWPHTWYLPCSGFYWNACWDVYWAAGWSVSIGLGNCYPYYSPYTWSWCSPTWCAPSWCYPGWYRPSYAYCGPRSICCRTGTCGSCPGCTGSTTRTYPSQTKYKNSEYAGSGAVAARGTKEKSGVSREYGLYTREDGSRTKSKRYTTGEDREGPSSTVRRVSDEVTREPRESAVKSKTSRKIYSTETRKSAEARKPVETSKPTETRKSAAREARPVEVNDDNTKSTSTKHKTTDTGKSSSRAVTTRKSSSAKTTTSTTKKTTVRKSSTESTSRTKVSESRTVARTSSTASPSKVSSSSSGSSKNHRGSPKTRRSVSR